jgi:hypothetical protein
MEYIQHRVNTVEQLKKVPPERGVEIDLRDRGDRLILQHDPFGDGEDFASFLREYRHGTLILNVKSERVEHRVLEEMQRAGTVRDYFFLDSSFPMIRLLAEKGERRIAVRFSEYEPIESALALSGKVQWLWIDCFTRMPLDEPTYARLQGAFKLCIVSPELQGHPLDWIPRFAAQLKPFAVDAVCTKRPEIWQDAW